MQSYSSRSLSSSTNSSSSENLPPRTLARVAREVRDLIKSAPEGTKLVVDSDSGLPASLSEIIAEVEGPIGTPYASRFFQLKLVLSADFPNSPPRGFFLTKIYHPNVDMSTGAICVNTLKKDWNPSVTLGHVLSVIRCLLIIPFPESSLNDEAGKLFMESYDEYARRAKLMTNVHGRTKSFLDNNNIISSPPGSPTKISKENENSTEYNNHKVSSLPTSSNAVLKQSNSTEINGSEKKLSGSLSKSTTGAKGSVGDKKSKKKTLKRL